MRAESSENYNENNYIKWCTQSDEEITLPKAQVDKAICSSIQGYIQTNGEKWAQRVRRWVQANGPDHVQTECRKWV